MTPRHRKAQAARKRRELKDRLVQTRVPSSLETALKDEAQKRRLSVSHLIRNVLEDAFELVGTVVSSAERIADESVGLATQVAEDASRIAATVRERREQQPRAERATRPARPPREGAGKARKRDKSALDDVLGWNQLVVHRSAHCVSCKAVIERGENGHLAVTATPPKEPIWLCEDCFAEISRDD
jgi:hypothetical protein